MPRSLPSSSSMSLWANHLDLYTTSEGVVNCSLNLPRNVARDLQPLAAESVVFENVFQSKFRGSISRLRRSGGGPSDARGRGGLPRRDLAGPEYSQNTHCLGSRTIIMRKPPDRRLIIAIQISCKNVPGRLLLPLIADVVPPFSGVAN